jgi:mRNA interferase RelE/StbE
MPRPSRRGEHRRLEQLVRDSNCYGLGTDQCPHPAGSRKLAGYDDGFRIRVGRYRIIYSVEGRRLIVILLKLGHRKTSIGESRARQPRVRHDPERGQQGANRSQSPNVRRGRAAITMGRRRGAPGPPPGA